MSHFLNQKEIFTRHLSRPRAGVKVRLEGRDTLVLCVPENERDTCVFVLGRDADLCPLPARMKVVDPEGKNVKPSKGKAFYVTLGTFNPFHGVTEVGDGDL